MRVGTLSLTALVFFIFGSPAHALLEFQQPFSANGLSPLAPYVDGLSTRAQRSLRNSDSWKASSPQEYRSCVAQYDRMYADGVLRINLSFGYADNYEKTFDPELYTRTYQALTRPCDFTRSPVCGFKDVGPSSSRKAILTKSVRVYKGERLVTATIQVTMAHSSHSDVDRQNFEGRNAHAAQRAATTVAEDVFFGGIANKSGEQRCDVCAYYGHARNGGGPDFSPVPDDWRDAEGNPVYDFYEKNPRNYRRLLRNLNTAKQNPPSLVAVFACYSQAHFWKNKICLDNRGSCSRMSLANFATRTGFLLTHQFSWFSNWEKNVGTLLDSVLGQKCRSALAENMKSLEGLSRDPEYFRLYGNFL